MNYLSKVNPFKLAVQMGNPSSKNDKHHQPRAVWKWEFLPATFIAYQSRISNLIEAHFISGSREILEIKGSNHVTYYIDVNEMMQINSKSKRKRRIYREALRDTFSTTRWSWENSKNEMQPYTLAISEKIEACYQKGDDSYVDIQLGNTWYRVTPSKQFQENLKSHKKRKIERNSLQDHKYGWQWQHDDGTFREYAETDSMKIELHYLARKSHTIVLNMGKTDYLIDTENMTQTNMSSEKSRQIIRVQQNYLQYHWLWKNKDKWIPFDSALNEKLEVNYHSEKQCTLLLDIDGQQYELNTIYMIKKRMEDYEQWKMKREPMSNDRPVWLWQTHNEYLKPFPCEVSEILEDHYLSDQAAPHGLENLELEGKRYNIDLTTMEKINVQNGNKKKIERQLISNIYPSAFDRLAQTERNKVFKFLTQSKHLPAEWEWKQSNDIDVFVASDIERNIMLEKFYSSMDENKYDVEGVFRIQNIHQMNNFLLERMNMQYFSHGINEPSLLFCIPGAEGQLEDLYKKPVPALKGQASIRTEYGKGYYFSKKASLCHDYAFTRDDQSKILVIFWVILGRVAHLEEDKEIEELYKGKCKAKKDLRKAPHGSDSVSGKIKDDEVNVIYKPELCLPLYYIHYREKPVE